MTVDQQRDPDAADDNTPVFMQDDIDNGEPVGVEELFGQRRVRFKENLLKVTWTGENGPSPPGTDLSLASCEKAVRGVVTLSNGHSFYNPAEIFPNTTDDTWLEWMLRCVQAAAAGLNAIYPVVWWTDVIHLFLSINLYLSL